ncbi:PBP1A family penicillin-binding protein [Rhodobaculum claviforme]|uniref:Penicillin-binding protein 1A n=1 Tax=Rhodobaculum claviforme TaxID=1549854 RepID=A0A934TLS1_9RHOB|nr:penicillin-binding protein [Rhodobaculum claviforme]
MLRFLLSVLGGLFSWITLAAIFAAVGVGGVLWMYSRDLPNHEQLAQYTPPTISRIYSGEGLLMDEFAQERRLFVPIGDVPDMVQAAFISAEDRNFWEHSGYDPRGMASALRDAVVTRGETLRGASTITQQVMKNFLLSGDRTGERKIKEIILATRLEETLEKAQILELYLNEIFLGQNSYGVAAAAQTYFNKTLDDLDLHEAAFLAALPQAPSRYHPVTAHDRVLGRRNWVLGQMHENGYITEAERDAARAEPLLTVQGGDIPSFREALPARDYFTDEIRRQLSGTFGEAEFFGGGLTIRATVDPDLQKAAARALRRGLERHDRGLGRWRGSGEALPEDALGDEAAWRAALARAEIARDIDLEGYWHPAVVLEVDAARARLGIEGVAADANTPHEVAAADMGWARGGLSNLSPGDVVHVRTVTSDSDGSFVRWSLRQVPEVQGGFMAMDVNSGRVLAMQGGFSYQQSTFNRVTQAQRQPGSAFKPFVFAAALDSGYTPATIVVDAPIEVDTGRGQIWRPTNYSNRFYGPTPVRTGIEMSRNLMTVRMAQEIGMDVVGEYAERFGVYDRMQTFLANSLGAQETTLFRMVAAYAMFANGGERVEPTLVDRVQDRLGQTVYRHDQRACVDCDLAALTPGTPPRILTNRERIMDPVTAYQLTSMMEGVVQRGTASRINLPVPIAGKTGTTNDVRDVWFVGFSSNIAAGCYIGHDRPRSLGQGVAGGNTCGPVFEEFMREAIAKYGGGRFAVPPGGYFINIDRFTGARLPDGASGANVVAEFFRAGEEPLFGLTVDGGFAMGANLPLVTPDGADTGGGGGGSGRADFGTLSSGGLY